MSLLGRLARGAIGFATGGPGGAAVGLLSPGPGGGRPRRAPVQIGRVGISPGDMWPGGRPGVTFAPPVGAPTPGTGTNRVAHHMPTMNGKGGPSGYHLNKTGYHLKDGTYVAPGTKWVKNRRRNPMNARALRRAIGRVDAAKAWQSKLGEISTGKYTASGKRRDKC